MAQRERKKPSGGDRPRRKDGRKETGKAGGGSADWTAAEGPVAGEEEPILDADPALEQEDKAREFPSEENPFEAGIDRPPTENPVPLDLPEGEEMETEEFSHRMTQPGLGDEDSGLEENLGAERGFTHLVDREDMGKGAQTDPEAYAADPGKPGMVVGATPPQDRGDLYLDPAARAGQGRVSAEDVLRHRGQAPGAGTAPAGARAQAAPMPPAGLMDSLLGDLRFPASKETVACRLAQAAYAGGGEAEAYHDLVVQLDEDRFEDIQALKRALGERFAWESAHGRPEGGQHGR
jgi:hypothetical protein